MLLEPWIEFTVKVVSQGITLFSTMSMKIFNFLQANCRSMNRIRERSVKKFRKTLCSAVSFLLQCLQLPLWLWWSNLPPCVYETVSCC